MGSLLGKQMQGIMDENLKKQQQFMLTTQKMQVMAPMCAVVVLFRGLGMG